MDFDGIDGFDLEGLSDEEIVNIYNEVLDNGESDDSQTLIVSTGNGWAYSK